MGLRNQLTLIIFEVDLNRMPIVANSNVALGGILDVQREITQFAVVFHFRRDNVDRRLVVPPGVLEIYGPCCRSWNGRMNDRSINQSINQSINERTNQSMNQ
jgi:hypothetical protein